MEEIADMLFYMDRQLSGINIFAFLAATVFNNNNTVTQPAGPHNMRSLWLSFGFAVANAVFSPVAYWFVDVKGRRYILLSSLIAMVPLLLATGLSFMIDGSAKVPVTEIFLILYTAAYSPGAGVVPFLYSSEVFPLINREVGMSLAVSVNFALGGVVALTVPPLLSSIGKPAVLGLFA